MGAVEVTVRKMITSNNAPFPVIDEEKKKKKGSR